MFLLKLLNELRINHKTQDSFSTFTYHFDLKSLINSTEQEHEC